MAFTLTPVQTLAGFSLVLGALQTYSASAQDVKEQVAACVACHATSDVPANSVNPIIWGQNEGYVYIQLRDFKHGARASESDVAMRALTQAMTDAQMAAIAKYVSEQPWPKSQDKPTPPTDPLFLRGAQLAALGDCGGCHFNNWQGYSANPRLRGQTATYLTTTINEFRSGKRKNAPGMADLLRPYSEDEIRAMVAYLSSAE
jgi:cytochrome c553